MTSTFKLERADRAAAAARCFAVARPARHPWTGTAADAPVLRVPPAGAVRNTTPHRVSRARVVQGRSSLATSSH
jgi:hypothetical protein